MDPDDAAKSIPPVPADDNDDDGSKSPPFTTPDDVDDNIPPDHPALDSNIDPTEAYDEGLEGAAEVDVPPKDRPA